MQTAEIEFVGGRRLRRKVRAIIQNRRGSFLLIQPHGYSDSWTLVGGGIEQNESPEAAILRELREEIGLDAFIDLKRLNVRHTFLFSEKQRRQRELDHDGQVATVFWVLVEDDVLIALQAEEVKAYVWVNPQDIASHVKVPAQLTLIQGAIEEVRRTSRVA